MHLYNIVYIAQICLKLHAYDCINCQAIKPFELVIFHSNLRYLDNTLLLFDLAEKL